MLRLLGGCRVRFGDAESQDRQSFLSFSARARLGLFIVIFYLSGMPSGGSLFALRADSSRDQD